MSNRQLKKMFGNEIIYAVLNYPWEKIGENYCSYECKRIETENYSFRIKYQKWNLTKREVKIYVNSKLEVISFNLFNKVYWVLLKNERRIKNGIKNKKNDFWISAIKELNRHHAEKEIAKIQQTIDNLTKIEKEFFKRLEK
ncbi:Uncharacterised protein [Niallia circulans]|uniref:hypothetical protein n=1 Tax=Niallia circulans TaxID=1397 RepID=UPI00077C647A|nr:hypothetical protein [Niallia circulans]MDR4315002.1 hypothetical protein [Niallia circulans]MED3839726.1 hypothetical protein [Niallia circulans]MED4241211.1 hypothetical protein [Niallia circulans]MED4247872.1 hypothetical protein [Niallia circulans]QKH61645.1 hypothetical protein FOC77_13795 [Niallia circulans]